MAVARRTTGGRWVTASGEWKGSRVGRRCRYVGAEEQVATADATHEQLIPNLVVNSIVLVFSGSNSADTSPPPIAMQTLPTSIPIQPSQQFE
ncbi:hypothetical protein E2562_017803 [Oryza meyeriana var. granulata]|uniref:Uncharacterized protein n=1 Tax=Oryza meyeriana var. granulata TaxID=110450 RepID=A0A6G1BL93_9ORYZ|nr:hypothetical protein E2562_017803 [Oryza meyeriana var. granulata]